jgi:hypothetical protein
LGAHQRFKAKTSGLDLDNAKARAKSKPSNKGKKERQKLSRRDRAFVSPKNS